MSTPSTSHRVLVTGSAGVMGRFVCRELISRGHWVRGFDLHDSPFADDVMQGDLADGGAVHRAVEGCDTIVHLGAYPNRHEQFAEVILPPNILGTYHVFESARRHKVSRVVAASSTQVVHGLEAPEDRPLRFEDGTGPTNMYAVSKVYAEAVGYAYARRGEMSVIVLRPAWMPRSQAAYHEAAANPHFHHWYLSPWDAARCFACAVEAGPIDYAVLFATSRPVDRMFFDIDTTRRLIGYEPQDTLGTGYEDLPAEGR
jgi:uronate dehydrogenase